MRIRVLALCLASAALGAAASGLIGTAGGVTAAHEYNHIVYAQLTGRGGGDPDGFGAFSAVIAGRTLCYGIQVNGVQPAAAHIHAGKAGTEGPVVVPLETPRVRSGKTAVTGGCATVKRELVRAIKKNPGRYYVNVHTEKFPGGAVRGQLAHPAR